MVSRPDARALNRRFKLEPEEVLLESHECALSSNGMYRRGELHIFEQHLCFACDQPEHKSSICIPFTEVEKVKKRRLALVLPEALLVRATSSSTTTATTDYLFALFASRDAAYTRIVNLARGVRGTLGEQSESGSSTSLPDPPPSPLRTRPAHREAQRRAEEADAPRARSGGEWESEVEGALRAVDLALSRSKSNRNPRASSRPSASDPSRSRLRTADGLRAGGRRELAVRLPSPERALEAAGEGEGGAGGGGYGGVVGASLAAANPPLHIDPNAMYPSALVSTRVGMRPLAFFARFFADAAPPHLTVEGGLLEEWAEAQPRSPFTHSRKVQFTSPIAIVPPSFAAGPHASRVLETQWCRVWGAPGERAAVCGRRNCLDPPWRGLLILSSWCEAVALGAGEGEGSWVTVRASINFLKPCYHAVHVESLVLSELQRTWTAFLAHANALAPALPPLLPSPSLPSSSRLRRRSSAGPAHLELRQGDKRGLRGEGRERSLSLSLSLLQEPPPSSPPPAAPASSAFRALSAPPSPPPASSSSWLSLPGRLCTMLSRAREGEHVTGQAGKRTREGEGEGGASWVVTGLGVSLVVLASLLLLPRLAPLLRSSPSSPLLSSPLTATLPPIPTSLASPPPPPSRSWTAWFKSAPSPPLDPTLPEGEPHVGAASEHVTSGVCEPAHRPPPPLFPAEPSTQLGRLWASCVEEEEEEKRREGGEGEGARAEAQSLLLSQLQRWLGPHAKEEEGQGVGAGRCEAEERVRVLGLLEEGERGLEEEEAALRARREMLQAEHARLQLILCNTRRCLFGANWSCEEAEAPAPALPAPPPSTRSNTPRRPPPPASPPSTTHTGSAAKSAGEKGQGEGEAGREGRGQGEGERGAKYAPRMPGPLKP